MHFFISYFDVSGGYGSTDADKKKPESKQTKQTNKAHRNQAEHTSTTVTIVATSWLCNHHPHPEPFINHKIYLETVLGQQYLGFWLFMVEAMLLYNRGIGLRNTWITRLI